MMKNHELASSNSMIFHHNAVLWKLGKSMFPANATGYKNRNPGSKSSQTSKTLPWLVAIPKEDL